jgi:hypothetical protein
MTIAVTSPAGGRGRGLSRGRGHDVNEGAISRVIPPRCGNPLPGLRARPLPEGEVTPGKQNRIESTDTFISPRREPWGHGCPTTVTSPAGGSGRGLSRGRGHDVNEGAIPRIIAPRCGGPFPGLRARPLPKGEVPPEKQNRIEKTDTFISPRRAPWGHGCPTTVTSPAGGRGRGLSRGRGHDVNEGAISGVIPPRCGNPLPGLTARPLPEGEVSPGKQNRIESTRHRHQPRAIARRPVSWRSRSVGLCWSSRFSVLGGPCPPHQTR